MNLFGLFRKKQPDLPQAAIFVDFEHWSISLDKQYRMRPKVRELYEEIAKSYFIKKLLFFGDFTNPTLRSEMDSIREITNSIIDTQNPAANIKKDYTDFIMLDYIYQTADESPDIDTYILLTGDGHFSSVASYLRVKKHKKVIVYGVRGAMSGKLKSIADECVELPTIDQERQKYYDMLINNFDYLFTKRKKKVFPTFYSTVKNVASFNHVSEDDVRIALQELMDKGVIVRKEERVDYVRTIKVLTVNWEQAIKQGLWSAERA